MDYQEKYDLIVVSIAEKRKKRSSSWVSLDCDSNTILSGISKSELLSILLDIQNKTGAIRLPLRYQPGDCDWKY